MSVGRNPTVMWTGTVLIQRIANCNKWWGVGQSEVKKAWKNVRIAGERSQHCPPGWGPDLIGEGTAVTHKMAEKPPSSVSRAACHGKLRGCSVRAAGCGRLPGAKRSAPTVSLQRPLLKKRNFVPAGEGKTFQGSSSVSERGQKAECGAQRQWISNQPRQFPTSAFLSSWKETLLGKTCISWFTQYLFYKSLQISTVPPAQRDVPAWILRETGWGLASVIVSIFKAHIFKCII